MRRVVLAVVSSHVSLVPSIRPDRSAAKQQARGNKFRRPADLWTPDYRTPMQDDLLWVYEGMTQFYGYVLGVSPLTL
jgi:M61 glycyl aminopeptidase